MEKAEAFSEDCGPQGLRRPRFSFFRFTCQTARNREGPTLRRTGGPSKPYTSDQDRKLGHRISVRASQARHRAERRTACRGVYIVLRQGPCQHARPQKSRTVFAATCAVQKSAPLHAVTRKFHRKVKPVPAAAGRRTAATFLGRSCGSGGRCQFGGHLCQGRRRFAAPPAYPKSAEMA